MTIDASGVDTTKSEEQAETVAFETHKRLLDQRKADQAKARDLQAKLDAAMADKEAAETTRLAEQAQWKDLYEKEKKKAEGLGSQLQHLTTSQIESRKREAVKEALGGVRKDDYLKFLDLNAVQLNDDGSVDAESVKAAANKFRESYPELVAVKPAGKIPNEAASGYKPGAPKSLEEMTFAEKKALLAKLI